MKNSIRHTKEAELAVPVLVMVKLLAIERYMYLCSPAGKITRILQGIPGDGGSLVEGNPRRNLGCK